ncbi:MAG TPA: glutathione peroxidase [Acidobacteriota bacterium]|nr:glutathione peroxidase [Acidobacteriota bacterium]
MIAFKTSKAALAALIVALFTAGVPASTQQGAYVLGSTVIDIDGNEVNLESYKGRVVLIVNVATKCGLTPQYEELQALHEKFAAKGLAILGFPANNFGNQEPGSNEEIKMFCTTNYNVQFDMFSKISVKGDDIAPLYTLLTSTEQNGRFGGEIQWNFTKFLVGKDGRVVSRYEPRIKPSDPEVIAAIERELAK